MSNSMNKSLSGLVRPQVPTCWSKFTELFFSVSENYKLMIHAYVGNTKLVSTESHSENGCETSEQMDIQNERMLNINKSVIKRQFLKKVFRPYIGLLLQI